MSVRPRSAFVAALCLGLGVALGSSWFPAEAASPTVVCSQIKQDATKTDDAFLAQFLSEQLAAGRSRFTTVQGVSTVVCAY